MALGLHRTENTQPWVLCVFSCWPPAHTDLVLHSDLHATVTCKMVRKGLEELMWHRLHGLFSPEPHGDTFRSSPLGVFLLKPFCSALVLLLHPPPLTKLTGGGSLLFFFLLWKTVWQKPRLKENTEVPHMDRRLLQFKWLWLLLVTGELASDQIRCLDSWL